MRIRVAGVALASSAMFSYSSDAAPPPPPSQIVFDSVEALPLKPLPYIVLAFAFVFIWVRHLYRLYRLYRRRAAAREAAPKGGPLRDDDWGVVDALRARGSALRARADSLLLGTVVLLFAGIYFVIWVIPQIEEPRDYLIKFKDGLQAWGAGEYWARTHNFEEPYPTGMSALKEGDQEIFVFENGPTLEALNGGRHWEESEVVTNASKGDPPNSAACDGFATFADDGNHGVCSVWGLRACVVGLANDGELIELLAEEGEPFRSFGYDTTEEVTAFEFHPGLEHGLIGTGDGAIHLTADGGKTWEGWTRQEVGLNDAEWVVGAVVGDEGPLLVVGSEGSARAPDDGEWKEPSGLGGLGRVIAVAFHPGLKHGLIGTGDGAIHLTADGGKTWEGRTRQEVGLSDAERVAGAVVGDEGPLLVVGNEGSVRAPDGGEWKEPRGVGGLGRLTALEFSPNLEHGLIGTADGVIHLTADGGKTWKRQTWREVGLNDGEWVVEAVVGDEGSRLVVGDEGSVRVSDGREWEEMSGFGEFLVTAFKFHADLKHGLIGTSDGAIHLTADGGKTWKSRTRQEVGLNEREWAVGAVVGDKGALLVVGDEGTIRTTSDGESRVWGTPCGDADGRKWEYVPSSTSVFAGLWSKTRVVATTADGGETWKNSETLTSEILTGPADTLLKVDEFLASDKQAWFRTSDGRVWTNKDGNWQEERFPWGEKAAAAIALDHEGEIVGVNSDGSLAIGEEPTVVGGEFGAEQSRIIAAAMLQSGGVVVLDDSGTLYLRPKPPIDGALSDLARDLPQGSLLAREIAVEREYLSMQLPVGERTLIEKLGIEWQFWVRRIAVSFAIVYLVQLLVRLHQYALRLAAFSDARADAVMLGSTFSYAKPSFDGLVAALAPDALDVKPPKWPIFASRTAPGGATTDR